jgi:hypothetical protein
MSEEKKETSSDKEVIKNGVKLIGERIIPGASLLMDGKIAEGSLHALLGLGAKAAFGLPGLFVLAANSYSKSVTGKGILEHATDLTKTGKKEASDKRDNTDNTDNS